MENRKIEVLAERKFVEDNFTPSSSFKTFSENLKEQLYQNNIEIQNFSWKIISWENYLKNIEKYDLILKSPWFSIYQNNLEHLKDKILTQTGIFFKYYTWKIYQVYQNR